MKLKRLSSFSSALVLSVSTLLTIGFTGVAHAQAPYTCTWTGSGDGTSFSDASNWSGCNSAAPVATDNDNLVFDNTSLASDSSLNNDITSLALGRITFQGTNSSNYSFTITGDAISLAGGITDTSNSAINSIETDITITASQSFTDTNGASVLTIGEPLGSNALNIGSYTLTLASDNPTTGGAININSALSGTGNIITDGGTSGLGLYYFYDDANGYSGQVNINNGQTIIETINAFGTASVIVANGASFGIETSGTSDTFSNPITIGGSGISSGGALVVADGCSASEGRGGCSDSGTTKLSGAIILTANTTVGTNATVDVSGSVTGNYTISLASSSAGSLTGTLTGIQSSNTSGNGSSSSTTAAPKTPNTGFALTGARSGLELTGCFMMAGGIYLISRKVRHPLFTKRH